MVNTPLTIIISVDVMNAEKHEMLMFARDLRLGVKKTLSRLQRRLRIIKEPVKRIDIKYCLKSRMVFVPFVNNHEL